MAVSLKQRGLRDRLAYYVQGQAPGLGDYLLQGLLTSLLGGLPGLPGIALRGLAYRLMLRMDGAAAIECNVRLRHARNIRLGANVYLDHGVYLHGCPDGIEIGADTCVMHNAELHVFNFRDLPHAFIKIGKGAFVGESVVIRGQGGVTIGDNVLIAPMVKILAVNHNYADVTRPVIDQGITGRGIVIEEGAWIGAGAAVLDGVRIGQGAVVGANAVVTKDVPAFSVAVGSPAKVVRDLPADALGRSTGRHSYYEAAQPPLHERQQVQPSGERPITHAAERPPVGAIERD
jgi:acetyltransferase-like isoleucine patch superfamily enzyme